MCGVLEDDVSHRAAMSLRDGLFGLLSDFHPEVTLAQDSRAMLIDKPRFADAAYSGAALTLVPSVFVWPRLVVSHSEPGAFEGTYAARGVARVWEGMDTLPDPRAIAWLRSWDGLAPPSSRWSTFRCRPHRSPEAWARVPARSTSTWPCCASRAW